LASTSNLQEVLPKLVNLASLKLIKFETFEICKVPLGEVFQGVVNISGAGSHLLHSLIFLLICHSPAL
jgi:hypothetical protein